MRSTVLACLLLVACGGGGDAPGGPDAGDPDADLPSGTIAVTAYGSFEDPAGPKPDVDIVAINPGGSSSTARTGPDGTAELTIVAGASVVAMYPDQFNGEYEVWAVLGAAPGDELVFGDPSRRLVGAETDSMTVTFPAVAGATGYFVHGECRLATVAAPATSVTIHHFTDCAPASQDLVLFAYNGATGALLGYGAMPDTPFTADGSVALASWEAPGSLTLEAAGIPDDVIRAEMLAVMATPDGLGYPRSSSDLVPSGGAVSWTTGFAPLGDAAEVRLSLITSEGQTQHTSDVIDAATTTHTFTDVAALPWVVDVGGDAATSTIEATTAGGRAPDATVIAVDLFNGQNYRWLVVAPPPSGDDASFTLPRLPSPFDGANLDSDGAAGDVYVTLLDVLDAAGYDELRQRSPVSAFRGARWSDGYGSLAP